MDDWGELVLLLVGLILTIPLYLIGKKIGKPVWTASGALLVAVAMVWVGISYKATMVVIPGFLLGFGAIFYFEQRAEEHLKKKKQEEELE